MLIPEEERLKPTTSFLVNYGTACAVCLVARVFMRWLLAIDLRIQVDGLKGAITVRETSVPGTEQQVAAPLQEFLGYPSVIDATKR